MCVCSVPVCLRDTQVKFRVVRGRRRGAARCSSNKRAPSSGEHGGACGFPGGEEGEDVGKHIVGESEETIGGGHRVVRATV